MPAKTHLRLVAPRRENRQVALRRPSNAELRPTEREYLTEPEIDKLIKAAKTTRNPHRDATIVLMMVRHGLRASETCELEWSQINLGKTATLHVRRAKSGTPSVHPILGDEMRALRQLQREQAPSPFVFTTERGSPFVPGSLNNLIKALGRTAGLPFPIHCHMLRHSCGFALANAGHDTRRIQAYLGHKSIEHTVRYTALSDAPFKEFWR
jgi:type 1 fimbriae regulatory protein FimB/type 1 fimbriae regulatory protein FimE